MAIGFLLDTNTVSFHIRRSSEALERRLQRTPAARVALSVVTEMELRYGLARNPRLRTAPLVEEFLAGITVVPLTSEAAPRVRPDTRGARGGRHAHRPPRPDDRVAGGGGWAPR